MIREDEELYATVADSVAALDPALDLDVPLDRILDRGTRLRRARRTLIGAGAAGTLAVAAALAIALPSAAGPGRTAVDVQMAGWSVRTNADSTVTLTIRELSDPAQLRHVLAQAGITAYVNTSTDPTYTDCRVPAGVRLLPGGAVVKGPRIAGSTIVMIVDPAAMPAGSVLGIFTSTTVIEHVEVGPATASTGPGSAADPTPAATAVPVPGLEVEAALFDGEPAATPCVPPQNDEVFSATLVPASAGGGAVVLTPIR